MEWGEDEGSRREESEESEGDTLVDHASDRVRAQQLGSFLFFVWGEERLDMSRLPASKRGR